MYKWDQKLVRLNVRTLTFQKFLSVTIKGLDNMLAWGQDLFKKLGIIYFTFLFVSFLYVFWFFSILLNHFFLKKEKTSKC